jgi:DDE superfamily endonuclease
MSPSDPMLAILAQFQPLFTTPSWKKMMTLLTGTILARGRRTVTAALWQTGHHLDSNFSRFQQVLNRARWSPLEVSRHLLSLIKESFIQAGGGIDVVIDETLSAALGSQDQQTWALARQRALQPRTIGKQSRAAASS